MKKFTVVKESKGCVDGVQDRIMDGYIFDGAADYDESKRVDTDGFYDGWDGKICEDENGELYLVSFNWETKEPEVWCRIKKITYIADYHRIDEGRCDKSIFYDDEHIDVKEIFEIEGAVVEHSHGEWSSFYRSFNTKEEALEDIKRTCSTSVKRDGDYIYLSGIIATLDEFDEEDCDTISSLSCGYDGNGNELKIF